MFSSFTLFKETGGDPDTNRTTSREGHTSGESEQPGCGLMRTYTYNETPYLPLPSLPWSCLPRSPEILDIKNPFLLSRPTLLRRDPRWQSGSAARPLARVDDPVFAHAIGNLVRCFAGRAQITQSPSLPGLPSLEWSCAVCANQILERGFTNSWLIELPCKVHARRPNHRSFACSKPSCACAPSCIARRILDPSATAVNGRARSCLRAARR